MLGGVLGCRDGCVQLDKSDRLLLSQGMWLWLSTGGEFGVKVMIMSGQEQGSIIRLGLGQEGRSS